MSLRAWASALLLLPGCFASAPGDQDPQGDLLHGLALTWKSSGNALLISPYEVTRSEYYSADTPLEQGHLPATGMTLAAAAQWADARGGRLLTEEEWFEIIWWPAGSGARAAGNTMELGMGRPLPVGVFESSRTTDGLYDTTGNVWEWVQGSSQEDLCVGGSYASYAVSVTRTLSSGDSSEDIGFRWCAPLASFCTEALFPAWQESPQRVQQSVNALRQRSSGAIWSLARKELEKNSAYPKAFLALFHETQ